MTKDELTYRREQLKNQADQLLIEYKKLTGTEQEKLENVLLEIEGLNIKITGPDHTIKNQVPRIRRRKKHSNNLQQLTLF